MLYADSKSSTTTSVKVVTKIAKNCADKIDGVSIKRIKIRADEKKSYTATFVVEVSAQTITPALEQLRCLIEDSFKSTLGLVFNTITFDVAKLTSDPKADVKKAQKRAQAITDNVDQMQDFYDNPTGEKLTDVSLPLPTDVVDEPTDTLIEAPTETEVDIDQTTDVTKEPTVVEQVDVDADVADGSYSTVEPVDSVAGDTADVQGTIPTGENFDESDE